MPVLYFVIHSVRKREKAIPLSLPPLRQASEAVSTLKNYSDQLRYFLVWLVLNGIVPSSPRAREIDFAFESFLHSFFSARDGRGLALARNLVSFSSSLTCVPLHYSFQKNL